MQANRCVTAPLCREGVKDLQLLRYNWVWPALQSCPTLFSRLPQYTKPELAAKPVPNPQVTPCQCFPGGLSELPSTTPKHGVGAAAAPQQRGFVKYWWCQATPTDTEAFQPSSASCYPLLAASARELENRTKHCCSVQLLQPWLVISQPKTAG